MPETMIWREGLNRWRRAAGVKGLLPQAGTMQPGTAQSELIATSVSTKSNVAIVATNSENRQRIADSLEPSSTSFDNQSISFGYLFYLLASIILSFGCMPIGLVMTWFNRRWSVGAKCGWTFLTLMIFAFMGLIGSKGGDQPKILNERFLPHHDGLIQRVLVHYMIGLPMEGKKQMEYLHDGKGNIKGHSVTNSLSNASVNVPSTSEMIRYSRQGEYILVSKEGIGRTSIELLKLKLNAVEGDTWISEQNGLETEYKLITFLDFKYPAFERDVWTAVIRSKAKDRLGTTECEYRLGIDKGILQRLNWMQMPNEPISQLRSTEDQLP